MSAARRVKLGRPARVSPGVRALLLGLAGLLGCAASPDPDSLEARLITQEREVTRLRHQVATLPELKARVETLEATLEAPSPAEPLNERILILEAEVARLSQPGPAAPPTPEVQPSDPSDTEPPAVIRPPNAVAPPPAGERVQPLSLASGALLMVQTEAGLVRVRLRGVEVPQPTRTYAEQPVLEERHRLAFGATATASDAAFKASRDYLGTLLTEVHLVLDYGDQPPPVGDIVEAYLIAERGPNDSFDVGAAMLRAGYATARGGHPKADRYRGLEEGARGAKVGLFADGE
ncbi:MAG: hypothetical protein KDD82_28610 [Planctomycetes bacterium]|nr:hypothetical protein [Planctomycetota bacterium]